MMNNAGSTYLHRLDQTIVHRVQHLVIQQQPRLLDVKVPMRARIPDPEPRKARNLAHQLRVRLRSARQHQPHALRHLDVVRRHVPAVVRPHRAREVPEIDGLAVGDEEDLARDGEGGIFGGVADLVEQTLGGEDVRVRRVLDVREVEEVLVCAELELGLVVFEDREHAGDELAIAGAEEARDAQGAGVHAVDAVEVLDEFLALGLSFTTPLVSWSDRKIRR